MCSKDITDSVGRYVAYVGKRQQATSVCKKGLGFGNTAGGTWRKSSVITVSFTQLYSVWLSKGEKVTDGTAISPATTARRCASSPVRMSKRHTAPSYDNKRCH